MSMKINSSFDPFDQEFMVLAPDGRTQIPVSLSFVHKVQVTTVQQGILQGSQIGAAALLLICLILVTRTDKRRSLVFILNALALFLVVVRGILQSLALTGPFYDWYQYDTGDYQNLKQAQTVSICGEMATLLLIVVLELSLAFQVRIVCCTLEPCWRHLINILNFIMALLVTAGFLALAFLNIKWNILGLLHETAWQFRRLNKVAATVSILFVVSVGISATIFCAKLAFAIWRRRSMGMTQFGPIQIIFIMGCQTMIAPFVVLIVTLYGLKDLHLSTFGPTVVALCLPLSAMWAAANTKNIHIANTNAENRHIIPIGRKNLASGKMHDLTSTTMSDTLMDDDSTAAESPSKEMTLNKISQPDLNIRMLEDGMQQQHHTSNGGAVQVCPK